MSYWNETKTYLSHHDHGPTCDSCGERMFPQDDHGRFSCMCGNRFDSVTGIQMYAKKIPQRDVSGMSNDEKAKVPPINRLDSEPTPAEAKVLSSLLRGPKSMDDPELVKARIALKEEREG